MELSDTIWSAVLSQLETQMTRASFEARLQDTWLIGHNGDSLVVGVRDDLSRDWLENRLYTTVQRVAAAIAGRPVDLEFRVEAPPAPAPQEPILPPEIFSGDNNSPGPLVARADFYSAFFGGKKDVKAAGFAMVSHYASQFWAPYLGRAFLLWKRLDAETRVDLKDVANRWSEVQIVTYNGLKDALNYPHSRYISGAMMECSQSLQAIRDTDRAIEHCCLTHSQIRTKTDRQGRPRCFFWYVGQLEELYDEKLVAIEVDPGSGHPRNHTVRLQLWRFLPILTPAQMGRLNGELQSAHKTWIEDFGHLLGLDYVTWLRITEPTLVDLMDGYDQYRQLRQPHVFASKFLKLPNADRIGSYTTLKS